MKLISGKEIANEIIRDLGKKISVLEGRRPGLAFILVGNDSASKIYVGIKEKRCDQIGFYSKVIQLNENVQQEDLLKTIDLCNKDQLIDGIIIQQPLPSHIDINAIIQAIDPSKDVDGFHPINSGDLFLENSNGFVPCTPLGIVTLLEKAKIETLGKHVVIIGRSNIVGKPLMALLLQKKYNCTVTVAHSKTINLPFICKQADILVSAVGKKDFIGKEMVKKDAIVIDVGISRTKLGIVGDANIKELKMHPCSVTPVPGGVGPMTIAMLMENVYKSFFEHKSNSSFNEN